MKIDFFLYCFVKQNNRSMSYDSVRVYAEGVGK